MLFWSIILTSFLYFFVLFGLIRVNIQIIIYCFIHKGYVSIMCYSEGKWLPAGYALRKSTLRSFAVRIFVQADSWFHQVATTMVRSLSGQWIVCWWIVACVSHRTWCTLFAPRQSHPIYVIQFESLTLPNPNLNLNTNLPPSSLFRNTLSFEKAHSHFCTYIFYIFKFRSNSVIFLYKCLKIY